MSNGPPPSKLCLLSDLPNLDVGDKVRFLSCVKSYTTATASLTLQHTPSGAQSRSPPVEAVVDVKLLLENLNAEKTRPGEWLNVIGYIDKIASPVKSASINRVNIQAIMLWPAGALNLQDYESSLVARMAES